MFWQKEVRHAIVSEFQRRKEKNPLYSLRSYSRFLGVSPGTLSEIVTGRKPVKVPTAQRILAKIDLPDSQRRRLEFLLSGESLKDVTFMASPEEPQDATESLMLSDQVFSATRARHEFEKFISELPNNPNSAPEVKSLMLLSLKLSPQKSQELLKEIKKTLIKYIDEDAADPCAPTLMLYFGAFDISGPDT